MRLAREPPVALVGRHERDDRDRARVGEQARGVRGAADVLGAVLGREAEVLVEPVAQVVAVEAIGRAAVHDQALLQRGRDRRLARRRQPGEPHGRAARAQRAPAPLAVELPGIPRDVGGT